MRTITNQPEDMWLNLINFLLGAVLFLSLWLFGFRGELYPTWNTWIFDGVIGLFALLAANQTYDGEEWLNLLAGLWVAIAPWLLGFSGIASAVWIHVVIGLAVVVLAGAELWRLYRGPEGWAT